MLKKNVLLLDSDRSSKNAIKLQLELGGIEVVWVGTSEQAIQKALSQITHLMICGDEHILAENNILHHFRTHPKLYRIPFIVVTDPFANNNLDTITGLGVNDILIKPFTGKILIDKVKRQLELAQLHYDFHRTEITDQIFGIVSRNFNQEILTPLNGIVNAVSFTQTFPAVTEDENLTELLQLIDSSCYRIQRNLMNIRLHTFFKTEFKQADIKIDQHVQLQDLLHDIIKKYKHSGSQLERMEITAIDTGEWNGPEDWIRVLFTELIDNALKFNGGIEPPSVKLQSLGGSLMFSVTNQIRGTIAFGLDDAAPFRKFHNDISRNGLGLGLYNCSLICRNMGYRLSMKVREQTVTFTLEA